VPQEGEGCRGVRGLQAHSSSQSAAMPDSDEPPSSLGRHSPSSSRALSTPPLQVSFAESVKNSSASPSTPTRPSLPLCGLGLRDVCALDDSPELDQRILSQNQIPSRSPSVGLNTFTSSLLNLEFKFCISLNVDRSAEARRYPFATPAADRHLKSPSVRFESGNL
jgi:hypothetical protein